MSLTTFINDRPIQTKAFNEVTKLLQTCDECLVKMFCGTGKSRVIQRIILERKHPLSVVVFPSLALIRQFTKGYLYGNVKTNCLLNVSSDEELKDITGTTDPAQIHQFLNNPKTKQQKKIICVTYQSLDVLLSSIGDTKIGIACFDEAHRTTSENAVKLVYGDECRAKYEKRVFFTATPVNANGITMFDRERDGMGTYGNCGPLACEYTYLQGLRDAILSLFELRIDLYTQDTLGNMYESIARAILTTGNTRVLTFHSKADEESDSETSVLRFVDKAKFVVAFRSVCAKEFPDKVGMFADERITFRAITATTKDKDTILTKFETCSDTEIYIVASCRTIGEGVDTKKANMCVFVDPKSSPKDIIQNIGRICRKVAGVERQPATVLIPVCIGWEKYREAGDDPEAQDKLIREQMNQRDNGDYNAIMNVCAALKQEDPELYELCLKYPSNFTEAERKHALEEQGFRVLEEHDENSEGEEDEADDREPNVLYEYDIDELVENGERVEIHTSNTEQPIVYRGFDDEDGEDANEDLDEDERPIQRFYEVEEENDDGEMETRYHRIVPMEGREEESDNKRLNPPNPTNRPRMKTHINDELKLTWKIGDIALGELFGSAVLECEVERIDPMDVAIGIVERADERKKYNQSRIDNQISIYPSFTIKPNNEQERKDAQKLLDWRRSNSIKNTDVFEYLDRHLSGWRNYIEIEKNERKLKQANELVERANERKKFNETCVEPKNVKRVLPRELDIKYRITQELEQEYKDALQLSRYRKDVSLNSDIRKLLDEQLEGWNNGKTKDKLEINALNDAKDIISRANERRKFNETCHPKDRKRILPRNIKNGISEEEKQEHKDSQKLNKWAIALRGDGSGICFDSTKQLLDKKLPGWSNKNLADKALITVKAVVERANERKRFNETCNPKDIVQVLPINIYKKEDRNTAELIQESFDHQMLKDLNRGKRKCPENVKKYLDENLPGWRPVETEFPSSPPPTKPKPRLVIKKSHLIPNPSACLECSAPETNPISNPLNPKRVITDSPYKLTGRAWSSQKSTTTHEKLRSNPAEWHAYHAARDISFQGYSDQSQIPRNRIIAHLANKRKHRLRILDLGCGRNNIAQHYADADKDHKFTIQGYDHVVEEGSTARAGNIADLSAQEDDESADICIYSQSLMGSDWRDYLTEGHRILRYNGEFIISEHIKMLDDVRAELGRLGCKIESEAADAGAGAVEASDADDKVAKWFVLVARKV